MENYDDYRSEARDEYSVLTDAYNFKLKLLIGEYEERLYEAKRQLNSLRKNSKGESLQEFFSRNAQYLQKKGYVEKLELLISSYRKILNYLSIIRSENNKKLSSVKEDLEFLCSQFDEKTQNKLKKAFLDLTNGFKQKINENLDQINNVLKSSKTPNWEVFRYDKTSKKEKHLYKLGDLQSVIKRICDLKKYLDTPIGILQLNKPKLAPSLPYDWQEGKIDDTIKGLKDNCDKYDPETQYVIQNYEELKQKNIEYYRLFQIANLIKEMIEKLKKIPNTDDIINILNEVAVEYVNKGKKLFSELNNCKFYDIIENLVKEKKKSDTEIQEKDDEIISKYVDLLKKLQKAIEENDITQRNEIQRQMDELYNAASNELRQQMIAISKEFKKEDSNGLMSNPIPNAAVLNDPINGSIDESINSYEENPEKELEKYAIQELEFNGEFNKLNTEEIAGDTRFVAVDKEELIKRKIEELKQVSEMDPIERGLYYEHKKGKLRDITSTEQLSYYDKEFLQNKYADENFIFIKWCKKIKQKSQIRNRVDTIYKEFILVKVQGYTGSFRTYLKEMSLKNGMSLDGIDDNMIREVETQGAIKR